MFMKSNKQLSKGVSPLPRGVHKTKVSGKNKYEAMRKLFDHCDFKVITETRYPNRVELEVYWWIEV